MTSSRVVAGAKGAYTRLEAGRAARSWACTHVSSTALIRSTSLIFILPFWIGRGKDVLMGCAVVIGGRMRSCCIVPVQSQGSHDRFAQLLYLPPHGPSQTRSREVDHLLYGAQTVVHWGSSRTLLGEGRMELPEVSECNKISLFLALATLHSGQFDRNS